VAIIADAAAATAALVAALEAKGVQRACQRERFGALKAAFRMEIAESIQPQVAYLDVIRDEMPEDGVLVDEMTQVGYAAKFAYPVYQPRSFITSSYQGTLGYGFATALGVQAANPGRRVISINGDGGFMYTMPELATAVLHGIGLVAIVFVDGNFGNVRRIQMERYGGRLIASHLHNPDFCELARLFGANGFSADDPDGLRQALRSAFACDGPSLIQVRMAIDEVASPWRYVHPRKVRP
jgi:acetolactate synthase-1/2/3 large subunit